jgi:hypothetical protein
MEIEKLINPSFTGYVKYTIIRKDPPNEDKARALTRQNLLSDLENFSLFTSYTVETKISFIEIAKKDSFKIEETEKGYQYTEKIDKIKIINLGKNVDPIIASPPKLVLKLIFPGKIISAENAKIDGRIATFEFDIDKQAFMNPHINIKVLFSKEKEPSAVLYESTEYKELENQAMKVNEPVIKYIVPKIMVDKVKNELATSEVDFGVEFFPHRFLGREEIMVKKIKEGSPAEASELKVGDKIIGVSTGQEDFKLNPFFFPNDLISFSKFLFLTSGEVTFIVLRGNEEVYIKIRKISLPQLPPIK